MLTDVCIHLCIHPSIHKKIVFVFGFIKLFLLLFFIILLEICCYHNTSMLKKDLFYLFVLKSLLKLPKLFKMTDNFRFYCHIHKVQKKNQKKKNNAVSFQKSIYRNQNGNSFSRRLNRRTNQDKDVWQKEM